MNYIKIYNSIISKAGSENRKKTKGGLYYELHHIIPKCMGGDNSKENLVLLTAKEHYLAHWLLAETYDTYSLWFAFHKMCYPTSKNKSNRYIPSSRVYALLKEKTSEFGKRKRSQKELNALASAFKGKKHSEESKLKISSSCKSIWTEDMRKIRALESKEKYENGGYLTFTNKNKKHSEQAKFKMSLSHKGKVMSESAKEKMSKSKKGKVPLIAIQKSSEKRKKKIFQYDLNNNFIKTWDSISEAEKSLNIASGSINRCLSGKYKKAKNYTFKYD